MGPNFPTTKRLEMGNCCTGGIAKHGNGNKLVETAEPNKTPEMVDREQMRLATEERLRKQEGTGKLSQKLKQNNAIQPGRAVDTRYNSDATMQWKVDS